MCISLVAPLDRAPYGVCAPRGPCAGEAGKGRHPGVCQCRRAPLFCSLDPDRCPHPLGAAGAWASGQPHGAAGEAREVSSLDLRPSQSPSLRTGWLPGLLPQLWRCCTTLGMSQSWGLSNSICKVAGVGRATWARDPLQNHLQDSVSVDTLHILEDLVWPSAASSTCLVYSCNLHIYVNTCT